MITEIGGKNFKGLEFAQPLSEKTIFVGPNGSGKTARIQALILAAIGYIPGGSSKTNAEILNTYSDADKLFVSFKLDKTELVRRFARNPKNGSVSQDFAKDGRKINKDGFLQAMSKAGIPNILDLPEFMSMSDQKKINCIFELFPPSDDIQDLDEQIQDLDEKVRAKQSDIRDNERLISKLTEAKTAIELPPGTLAELKNQIEGAKAQYKETSKKLENARIEKAQAEAAAKAKKEAEEKAEEEKNKIEKGVAEKANAAIEAKIKAAQQPRESPEPEKTTQQIPISPEAQAAEDRLKSRAKRLGQGEFKPDPLQSIQLIIDTINKVGCQACTAIIVAKLELKKYQKEAAA